MSNCDTMIHIISFYAGLNGRFLIGMDVKREIKHDFKHELKRISFEFAIRFSELFLVGLILSLLLQLFVYLNVFEHRIFVLVQFIAFTVFEAYNVRSCIMSEKRIHRKLHRYYIANIFAYLSYILISYVIFHFFGISYYSYMFGISLTLTTEKFMTYSYLYKWVLIFHIISLIIIIFSIKAKKLVKPSKNDKHHKSRH